MSDVITRFKLETTQYDSKLRDASKQLTEFTRTCQLAGNEFGKFAQSQVESARAFGSIETGASNVKDKLKELVNAYNQVAKAYNALTEDQKKSDYGKALGGSLQQLQGRITQTKKELYDLGDSAKSTGGLMEALGNKFMITVDATKLLDMGLNALKGALSVAGDAFKSSESNVDEWGRVMESAGAIYDSFCIALNNADFGTFFQNIGRVTQAARDAYDAMDKLRTVATIQSPERAKLQAKQTELQAKIRRYGKNSAEGRAAQRQLEALQPQLRSSFASESRLNKDAFQKEVMLQLTKGGITLGKADLAFLMKSFESEDAYNRLVANATGNIKTVSSGQAAGTGGWQANTTIDTRNINAKLRDLFTDEWRQKYSPYLTASYTALGASYANDRANARYLNGGGGGGGGGRGGAAYDPKTRALVIGAYTSPLAGVSTGWGPETPETRMANWLKNLGAPAGLTFTEATDDARAAHQKEIQKEAFKEGMADFQKNFSEMLGGVNQLVGGVEQLGIKVPAGINRMLSVLQGIMSIVTAIQTLSTLKLFSGGGVVKAADGYTVPGNYGYDRVPALLTSGEVVLNRSQVSRLAGVLQDRAQGGGGSGSVRVSGEDIYIAVTNYMSRRGYGEIAIGR